MPSALASWNLRSSPLLRDDIFLGKLGEVKERGEHASELVAILLFLFALGWRQVGTGQSVGTIVEVLQELADSRHIVGYVVLVPTLLVVVCAVLFAIGVTEGDVLHVLACEA